MSDQVFIAAISAGGVLLGVCLSQLITLLNGHLARKHERQILLRQKYEKMVDDFNLSLMKYGLIKKTSKMEEMLEPLMLARNVYSICTIYFHKLQPYSTKYLSALIKYLNSIKKLEETELEELSKELSKAKSDMEKAIGKNSIYYT